LRAACRAHAGDHAGAREDYAATGGPRTLPSNRDRLTTLALLADADPPGEDAAAIAAELSRYAGRLVLIDRGWGYWGRLP
jgi:hypothetical protein